MVSAADVAPPPPQVGRQAIGHIGSSALVLIGLCKWQCVLNKVSSVFHMKDIHSLIASAYYLH